MSEGDLSWTIDREGAARIAAPVGRVDESTAAGFAERLAGEVAAAGEAGERRVVLDLAGIGYMSSRGLRALTLAQRRAAEHGVTLVLARPNAVMREILAISRYDKVFEVFDAIEAARAG